MPERYMTKTRLDTRRNRLCILHCKRSPKHDKVTFEHTYFDNSIGMIMSKVSGKGTTFMYAHGIHSRAKLSLAIKLHSYNKYSLRNENATFSLSLFVFFITLDMPL